MMRFYYLVRRSSGCWQRWNGGERCLMDSRGENPWTNLNVSSHTCRRLFGSQRSGSDPRSSSFHEQSIVLDSLSDFSKLVTRHTHFSKKKITDRSEVTQVHVLREVQLKNSEDLLCKNIMCEHVSKACVCRLALTLDRLLALPTVAGLTEMEEEQDRPSLVRDVQAVDLSDNQLVRLPDQLWHVASIRCLVLSNNLLEELPETILELQSLEILDLTNNPWGDIEAVRRLIRKLPNLKDARL